MSAPCVETGAARHGSSSPPTRATNTHAHSPGTQSSQNFSPPKTLQAEGREFTLETFQPRAVTFNTACRVALHRRFKINSDSESSTSFFCCSPFNRERESCWCGGEFCARRTCHDSVGRCGARAVRCGVGEQSVAGELTHWCGSAPRKRGKLNTQRWIYTRVTGARQRVTCPAPSPTRAPTHAHAHTCSPQSMSVHIPKPAGQLSLDRKSVV